MLNLGTVRPGSTIYIPFDSFDGGTGASVALTGLAATDIEVYKDGSVTQRASDNGYTLLDTDGIDFDGITGINGFSISLADNSTAGFWASGSRYFVVVSSVTIDSQVVNFVAATFHIGYPDALLDTTIATLASQTSFTLTAGPAEDDALNGCVCVIHDVASAVQLGFAVVVDYTGSTKTVTLTAGVTFTAAATDNISFYPPGNTKWVGATAQTAGDVTALVTTVDTVVDTILVDTNELQTDWVNGGRLDLILDIIAADTTTDIPALIAALDTKIDTIDNFLDTEIAAILEDTGTTLDDFLDSEVAAILADTNELQTDWANGGRLDLLIDAIKAVTDLLTAAQAEPTGVPAADETPLEKLGYVFMALRNKLEITSTKKTFYDDGGAAEWEKDVADDGTTYSESEGNAI